MQLAPGNFRIRLISSRFPPALLHPTVLSLPLLAGYGKGCTATAVRLQLRDYLGAVESLPGGNRTDTQHTGLIALDWQPMRFFY